jgi:hypothetical protein
VFTRELLPLLLATAKVSPGSTRVIWTASNAHHMAPKESIDFKNVNLPNAGPSARYGQSKAVTRKVQLIYQGKYPSRDSHGAKVLQ